MPQPVIFISYSHKDEREKDKLVSHLGVLRQEGLLDLWSDDRIGAGGDWEQEISEAMVQARVAILLISANFLTSDFILSKEVPILLKRRKSEGLTVFPVIAKACAWSEVGWLTEMNVRPKNDRPIWGAGSRRVDEDLAAIAKEVATIIRTGPNVSPTDSSVSREAARTENFSDFPPASPMPDRPASVDISGNWLIGANTIQVLRDKVRVSYNRLLGRNRIEVGSETTPPLPKSQKRGQKK